MFAAALSTARFSALAAALSQTTHHVHLPVQETETSNEMSHESSGSLISMSDAVPDAAEPNFEFLPETPPTVAGAAVELQACRQLSMVLDGNNAVAGAVAPSNESCESVTMDDGATPALRYRSPGTAWQQRHSQQCG